MLPTVKLQSLHRALLDGFSLCEFRDLLEARLGVRLELLAPPG